MSEEKLNIKLTFFIGLAFFTTGIAWSIYNTQVNVSLFAYLGSYALVGIWMAMDNVIGVLIQPVMGSFSDNTRTRFGRRMPYIIVGIPLAAFFFILIPFETSLWILLLFMFLFNISMASYRSQAVALMPDFVKPQHRSKGNAIINLMGGLGAIIAYTFNLILVPISLELTFFIVAIIMVASLVVLLFTVKEKESYSFQIILKAEKEGKKIETKKEKLGLIESFKDILSEKDKSTLFMLLAIFFWFVGYQGLEALFTIYGVDVLGMERGPAGFMFTYVAIPFVLFAFPAGIIATKIGRRLTIKIGLVLFIVALFIGFLIPTITMITIAFIIAGIGWALVNINSIVIVWEMARTEKKIGTYTGVYYFFSFMAAIIGPYLVGLLVDVLGPTTLLLDGAIFLLVALILMFFVKRGEVELTEEEKLAKKKAIQEL